MMEKNWRVKKKKKKVELQTSSFSFSSIGICIITLRNVIIVWMKFVEKRKGPIDVIIFNDSICKKELADFQKKILRDEKEKNKK